MLRLDQQIMMFDYPISELQDLVERYQREKRSLSMLAMGMISDAQEMAMMGLDPEKIRRTLNRAKYIIDHIEEKSGR